MTNLRGEKQSSILRRQGERLRVNAGIQCPECFGVQVLPRQDRFDASPTGFLCPECGCQWDRNYYPKDAK
jgi:hypothetical protein